MNTTSTPVLVNKKRPVSSPEDLLELKKSYAEMASSNIPESEMPSHVADPVVKINLSPENLQSIAQLVQESVKHDLQDLINSDILESKFESIVQRVLDGVAKLQDKVNDVKAENVALRKRVTDLERIVDKAEQYSRRNCLRLSGVSEQVSLSTDQFVLKMASDLDVQLSISDIDRSHRLG